MWEDEFDEFDDVYRRPAHHLPEMTVRGQRPGGRGVGAMVGGMLGGAMGATARGAGVAASGLRNAMQRRRAPSVVDYLDDLQPQEMPPSRDMKQMMRSNSGAAITEAELQPMGEKALHQQSGAAITAEELRRLRKLLANQP